MKQKIFICIGVFIFIINVACLFIAINQSVDYLFSELDKIDNLTLKEECIKNKMEK